MIFSYVKDISLFLKNILLIITQLVESIHCIASKNRYFIKYYYFFISKYMLFFIRHDA